MGQPRIPGLHDGLTFDMRTGYWHSKGKHIARAEHAALKAETRQCKTEMLARALGLSSRIRRRSVCRVWL